MATSNRHKATSARSNASRTICTCLGSSPESAKRLTGASSDIPVYLLGRCQIERGTHVRWVTTMKKVPSKPPTSRDTRRRFEQWAKNPDCEANTLSALLGVSMADVAKAEGLEPTTGQSPMALIRGQQFEALLLRDDAARLREELEKQHVLQVGSSGLLDLRMRRNGGPMKDLDEARDATSASFARLANVRSSSHLDASIIAGATVSVPGGAMLPEAILVLDILAVTYDVTTDAPTLVVGEIKVYPDRGGDTDRTELATARAQAGIYIHGLRAVLDSLGLADSIRISTRGFLVFTRPGSNHPSVRAGEDLEFQARRAERGLARLRQVAAKMATQHGATPKVTLPIVQAGGTCWSERCPSFCDRARGCREKAMAAGDPAAFGDDVARFAGPVGLGRVRELLNGKRPDSAAETDLMARYDAASSARGPR